MWWREIYESIVVGLILGGAGAAIMAITWWLGS